MLTRITAVTTASTTLSMMRSVARPVRKRMRSTSCTARESSWPVSDWSWKEKDSRVSLVWMALRRSKATDCEAISLQRPWTKVGNALEQGQPDQRGDRSAQQRQVGALPGGAARR